MAGLTISVKSNVSNKIGNLKNKMSDMTPFFKDIADLELSQTKLRFTRQVNPQGEKWPKPFTIRRGNGPETGSGARTNKRGWDYVVASNFHATPPGYRFFNPNRGDKVLRDTGNLFKSIGRAYGRNFASVGTNVGYAKTLQAGKFQMFGINQKTIDNINKIARIYFGRL